MSCPDLHTGTRFLATTLVHLDCQGRTIGAYGYGALADPASGVAIALTGLLTVFIALFGIRVMLGGPPGPRDVIGDVVRVGFVLTLALSWPAWRVIGYDLVLDAPSEVARDIGAATGLPGTDGAFIERVQNADDGIVAMTMYGTGRLTGGVVAGSDLGDSFHGIALADQTGFGWGRIVFLTSVIGPWAITRIGAGILLAIAPLMAGLLLFGQTTGLFAGWLRGLALLALLNLALTISTGVEMGLVDPWLSDVLAQRGGNSFTPSAPTELVVIATAFATLDLGMMAVIARIAFMPHLKLPDWFAPATGLQRTLQGQAAPDIGTSAMPGGAGTRSQAQRVADAMDVTLRREAAGGLLAVHRHDMPAADRADVRGLAPAGTAPAPEPLGSSYRRSHGRRSAAGDRRDRRA